MENFGNMKKKAQDTTDKLKDMGTSTSSKIKGIGTATTDKINEIKSMTNSKVEGMLAEFHQAIASLQVFGLKPNKMHVSVTIPPEVSIVIHGSMQALEKTRLQEMLEANREKKLLSTILTALLTADALRSAVQLESLNNLTINITRGIPPSVSVDVD